MQIPAIIHSIEPLLPLILLISVIKELYFIAAHEPIITVMCPCDTGAQSDHELTRNVHSGSERKKACVGKKKVKSEKAKNSLQ